MENNNYNQEVIKNVKQHVGDKLKNLVYSKTEGALESVHHDVGVMFMYQASSGVLEILNTDNKRHYLDGYILDISTIETLYNEYSSIGNGLQFNFIFLTRDEYVKLTGDSSVLDISELSNEFLYLVVTPLDNHNNPFNRHFVIFNLNYAFDINSIIVSESDFITLRNNFLRNNLYEATSTYSSPKDGSVLLRYTWDNLKEIMNETNSSREKYRQVQFILGEVTPYKILSDFFRRNPQYGLDEPKYRRAYSDHEKQLTVVGMYLPEEINGKEGYFDMGSLYP
ncbi:hypothetical protein WH221_16260 [Chryseobacterium culicis]|uniref:Uncharacterized protein n=1 Tax=Chryseobacterium culicis TaxID=680127 RepID=A0A2S9CT11_CHRCI|nr:hypothetical protein [Chryseobacterium culicis]PRB83640.1 hypothetical protein CQ022_16215 [Chryseobacterium culicis]PRB89882.1 hypothetical protein CQ033_15110 [Chryseobacterium culicis]